MDVGMGKQRAQDALKYLVKLFPRWKTNDELNAVWVDLLAAHDAETVTIVLKAHRAERAGSDPNLRDVKAMLAAAARQRRLSAVERGMAPRREPECPEGLSWPERARWALSTPGVEMSPGLREEYERGARGELPKGPILRRIVEGQMSASGVVGALTGSLPRSTPAPKRDFNGLVADSVESLRFVEKGTSDAFDDMRGQS